MRIKNWFGFGQTTVGFGRGQMRPAGRRTRAREAATGMVALPISI